MHDTGTGHVVQAAYISGLTWFVNVVNQFDYGLLTHVLTLLSIPATLIVLCNGLWRFAHRARKWRRAMRRKRGLK